MDGYRLLDHTADVGIEVEATDRDRLFGAAWTALTDCLVDLSRVGGEVGREFSLRADSEELLLVAWLEELVWAFEVRRELYSAGTVRVVDEADGVRLEAELRGERFDPDRHPVRFVIKAVTYHDLALERRGGEWYARVIFDL